MWKATKRVKKLIISTSALKKTKSSNRLDNINTNLNIYLEYLHQIFQSNIITNTNPTTNDSEEWLRTKQHNM